MTNIIKISREFKDNILGSIWLGREIEIGEAADSTSAFIKANEELVNAYAALNPQTDWKPHTKMWMEAFGDDPKDFPYNNGKVPTIQVSKKEQALNNFIEAIQTSTTLKGVEIFRPLVERENNPSLTEAFETKIKELQ